MVCALLAGACQGQPSALEEKSTADEDVVRTVAVSPVGDVHLDVEELFDTTSLHPRYELKNDTTAPVGWAVELSEPWLSVAGPSRAVLAPGESVEVIVDIDVCLALERGEEFASGSVKFVDAVTAEELGRCTVSLQGGAANATAAGGWTTLNASSDSRMVYVSASSGNDQNDGLSPATPKHSIDAGKQLLRHGYPDWLLLKRGDVWSEPLGQWKKSGRSIHEPMVVTTYGTSNARPHLKTGIQSGVWTHNGGGSPATIDHVAFLGVHFDADQYVGDTICVGAQMLQPASHVLFEDCMFEGYTVNVVFQGYGGRHTDFRLRRSVIVDAFSIHAISGHSQGLYASDVDGLLIEENVFDHNGWNANVAGAGADMFSHNIYVDNGNTGVVVHGNIIANGSSHGMQLRPGGVATNNLFVRNSIALNVGGGNNPEPGGVKADVRGNVIVDGKNIDAAQPRGWGIWLANIESGEVSCNVIANNTLGSQPSPLMLDGTFVGDTGPTLGVHDLLIEKNVVYNWGGSIYVEGDSTQIRNVDLVKNDVQDMTWPWTLLECPIASASAQIDSSDNQFFSQLVPSSAWVEIGLASKPLTYWLSLVGDTNSKASKVKYFEPTRSPASYNATQGGANNLDAFLSEARSQSWSYWRPEYTAAFVNRYIRNGF